MNDETDDRMEHISVMLNMPGPFGDGIRAAAERKTAYIAEHGVEAWDQHIADKQQREQGEWEKRDAERRSLLRLKNSGFGNTVEEVKAFLDSNSFERFKAVEPWQKEMLGMCRRFIAQETRRFMYLSGQPGGGKTHLGTAVSAHYISAGKSTRYAIHGLLMTELKGNVNDDEEYWRLLNEYGGCDVLYLDDFMKPIKDAEGRIKPPTVADIDHSFKLINMRYARNSVTVITSERSLDEIIELDEALGSRIKQRCGDFTKHITPTLGRNYRM